MLVHKAEEGVPLQCTSTAGTGATERRSRSSSRPASSMKWAASRFMPTSAPRRIWTPRAGSSSGPRRTFYWHHRCVAARTCGNDLLLLIGPNASRGGSPRIVLARSSEYNTSAEDIARTPPACTAHCQFLSMPCIVMLTPSTLSSN